MNKINFGENIDNIVNQLIEAGKEAGSQVLFNELKKSEYLQSIDKLILSLKIFQETLLQNEKNQIIIGLGTSLVFTLRQFILNEGLKFGVAGETETGQLKEKIYKQDEIFGNINKYLFINLEEQIIQFNTNLMQIKELDNSNETLASKWKAILKYGFIEDYNKAKLLEDQKENKLYVKREKDYSVYIRFRQSESSKNKTLLYTYYNIGQQHGQFIKTLDQLKKMGKYYNKGWLYQWLKANQDIEIDNESDYPLYDLMTANDSRLENIPGIKAGDVGNIQYKFGNRKIISFKNLLNIIRGTNKGEYKYNGLIPTLEFLKKSLSNEKDIRLNLQKIVEDFTYEQQDKIEEFVKNSFNKIIQLDISQKK